MARAPERAVFGPGYSLVGNQHAGQAAALAINPPASHRVLESLSAYLTPPQDLVLRPGRAWARSSGYDDLAAHCLQQAQKPSPELMWAYRACAEVTRCYSKSFYFSARLLPAAKRHAVMSLYAFCRLSDDLVDDIDM